MGLDRGTLFNGLRGIIGSLKQEQVEAINAIADVLDARKVNAKHSAYVFATAYHESRMQPVRETFASSDNQAISRLNKAYRSKVGTKRCYWCKDPNGQSWYGRGFVQLTWKTNYEKMSKRLGLDLVSNPDKVLEPETAAKILVIGMQEGLFTGKGMKDYTSFYHMRRVVNGTDKAKTFSRTADKMLTVMNAAMAAYTTPIPIDRPTPKPIDENVDERVNDEFEVIVDQKQGRVFVEIARKRDGSLYEDAVNAREVAKLGFIDGENKMESKHALGSTTVRGVLLGAITVGLPPLMKMLGYDVDQLTASELGQHGAALVQLLVGVYASGLALHGRQEAQSRIWWFNRKDK